MLFEPTDRPSEPASKPASSGEIFSSPQRDDESSDFYMSEPKKVPLALPKKRPLILWLAIALLLGGLIALILVGIASD